VFADPFGNEWGLIEPVTVHEDQSAV
jgi:hypothetical protein